MATKTNNSKKQNKTIKVIILAAGKSTRMKSNKSKVLHKIAGTTILSHVIDAAKKLHAKQIVTVIREDMEDVKTALSGISSIAIQKQPKGTADAVKAALPQLKSNTNDNGHIIILYADTPFIQAATLKKMQQQLTQGADIVILGFKAGADAAYGKIITNDDNEVEKIVEFKDANSKEKQLTLCNSGVIALKSKYLPLVEQIKNNNAKNEFYLTDIIQIAKQQNLRCVYILCEENEVIGINNKKELAEAETIIQDYLRNKALEQGVTMPDPKTVYLASDTKFGSDIIIEPNVVIGKGVKIDDNVIIKAFSHIEHAHIKHGSVIGPFARIRPESIIGPKAKIGNFVEIKKSTIKSGAKVSHLSYIGDSTLEDNVNIGAGVITCNYDGKNKYRTKIGSNAFIGSNTAIIAPVTIGKDAVIAAGSAITDDVPANNTAFARARQENKAKNKKNEHKLPKK